jgi:non-heme chloroperoxidase
MQNRFRVSRRSFVISGSAAIALAGCGGDDGGAGWTGGMMIPPPQSQTPPPPAPSVQKRSVEVSDGTRLNVLSAGDSGPALVMIPGWSQTAEQFKFQLEGLSTKFRVFAIDLRGHGDSEKPNHGYRIQRLAKDLDDVLSALDIRNATLMGHSMGCSVLWCHFEMHGASRISKYVFCDQASFLTVNPLWTAAQRADYGPIFTPDTVSATANSLRGPDASSATVGFLRSMVTSSMPAEQFQWIVEQNMKMPRALAADLLYNHCQQDWRDVLPRIDRPALFIGGKASLVPTTCVAWESTQVPGARVEIFDEGEKGSHFMFIENAGKFNSWVAGFAA